LSLKSFFDKIFYPPEDLGGRQIYAPSFHSKGKRLSFYLTSFNLLPAEHVMSYKNVEQMLEATSRTFYIPIMGLPPRLKEAVMSAYLCLRAIDEIEDHPHLAPASKIIFLQHISHSIQVAIGQTGVAPLNFTDMPEQDLIPEVTARMEEWLTLAPADIAPLIWSATAAMADRMAYWVAQAWRIHAIGDLNAYTFSVAGSVGLLLSDLWTWHNGTQTDRVLAVGFGRGLQTVNILRNREEDLGRAVDLFPPGWTFEQMHAYALANLKMATAYTQSLPVGPVLNFCQTPLALANATLAALAVGRAKLTREEVMDVLSSIVPQ
jgi:farnesyl-diphosphate farnesyltransferase